MSIKKSVWLWFKEVLPKTFRYEYVVIMKTLYLFTKDLRFDDNHALKQALSQSSEIAFLYVWSEELSDFRKQFAHETLKDLSKRLVASGHKLYLAENFEQVSKLASDFEAIYMSQGYLDAAEDAMQTETPVHAVENATMYRREDLPCEIDDIPKVFTDFKKSIEKEKTPLMPQAEEVTEKDLKDVKPHELELNCVEDFSFNYEKQDTYFAGGEEEGKKRLSHYFNDPELPKTYKETRNGMLNFNDSTKFSPWLALGNLSPRTIIKELKSFEEQHGSNKSTYWIWFELLWRDFFKFSVLKYGQKFKHLTGLHDRDYDVQLQGQEAQDAFTKWRDGRNGQDFIDANMIELKTKGWMSNRGRQNVASYLCHHIGVDWRWGAEWFEHCLIDYDAESNWGNWSYLAGVGNDPRDRVFNPQKQSDRYDPHNEYIKTFLNK